MARRWRRARRRGVVVAGALTAGCVALSPLSGCGGTRGLGGPNVGADSDAAAHSRAVGTAFVNLTSTAQTIRGFGGSTAWLGALSDNEMNSLFSNGNNQQMGCSILRLRIDPTQNWSAEISNTQKAKARGASVMATAWTPPASMKDNNNV